MYSQMKIVQSAAQKDRFASDLLGFHRLIGWLSSRERLICVESFIAALRKTCWWVLDLSGGEVLLFRFFLKNKPVLLHFGHGWRWISRPLGTGEDKT